jgi:hypothetical protein
MSPRIDPKDFRQFDNAVFSARNRSPISMTKEYAIELPSIPAGVRF